MSALDDDLVRHISASLAVPKFDSVTHLPNAASVADSTQKYIFQAGHGRWILIISSEISPLIVQRGADRQRQAKSLLRGNAGESIELPVVQGFHVACSYALWPLRQPMSSNPFRRKVEKLLLAPRVFRWLREVASQTVKPADRSAMAEHAARLQGVAALPSSIKSAAEAAERAFLSGKVPALHVLHHGDLWRGNVLRAPSKTGFIIIDWAGAKIDGVPFFDLVKFGRSIGASRSRLRREFAAHGSVLGCHPSDALPYVLCSLGRLSSELEYFPETMFVEMCKQHFQTLSAVT
jgi:hypothetical protein